MKSARSIFYISFFLLSSTLFAQYAVIPWTNKSDYVGKWNLSIDIPTYVAKLSRENYNYNFISPKNFLSKSDSSQLKYFAQNSNPDIELLRQIAVESEAEYVILGNIETFSLNRYMAGEPVLAGYEHYSCTITCNLKLLLVKTGSILDNFEVSVSMTKNTLGFSFIGKPTEEKLEFYNFDKIPFGSENFEKTLVGETMLQFTEKMHGEISSIIKTALNPVVKDSSMNNTLSGRQQNVKNNPALVLGEVIFYDTNSGETFINIGENSGLQVGDILTVYVQGAELRDPETQEFLGFADQKLTDITVAEIRGPKLSLGYNSSLSKQIVKGQKVKFHKTKRQP